ncbi:MAG: polysaccharide biosynthesis/export family protein [Pirellulaceae bacterium]|nr:polysaccharide biosynthesis/export family protein [Pirellulaceae bacterium]
MNRLGALILASLSHRCLLLIFPLVFCAGCQTIPLAMTGNELDKNVELLAADDLEMPVEKPTEPDGSPTFGGQNDLAVQRAASMPPKELSKVILPEYRIEPPDILILQAIRMVPKTPYFIEPLDGLQVVVSGTLPDQPIAGVFFVEANGTINIGPAYGSVKVMGLSIQEAEIRIMDHLKRTLQFPQVGVSLVQSAAQQQIAGEHLVGPDGMINLGVYGKVLVTGLTLDEARQRVEQRLEKYLDRPQVSLDVYAYNSKAYYVITEGAGLAEQVNKFPITGNETVLDAVAQIGGITRISSKKMWIARPSPYGNVDQVLPVDWVAITKGGNPGTNYQLLPNDRLFIAEDRLVATDTYISKLTAPIERIFGGSLLGAQTIQTMQRFPKGNYIR